MPPKKAKKVKDETEPKVHEKKGHGDKISVEKKKESKVNKPVAEKDGSESVRSWTSLYYIVVILAIGIPVWIKTTSPVRYPLPDVSALMVHSQMITHHLHIIVIAIDGDTIGEDERSELRQQLNSNWPRFRSFDGAFAFELKWKIRPAHDEEIAIFKNHSDIGKIDSELSEKALHITLKKLKVYLVDDKIAPGKRVWFGMTRFAYLNQKYDNLAETIYDTITALLEPNRPSDIEEYGSVKSSSVSALLDPSLDITISIIPEDADPAPEELLAEIERTKNAFLKTPALLELLKIKVTSRMIYHAIDSEHIINADNQVKRIADSSITDILNRIESRIVETESKNIYNLNLLIPSPGSRMFFYESKTGRETNSLVSSHKVGAVILNDIKEFNPSFKALMRLLLGLPLKSPENMIQQDAFATQWELDFVMRTLSQGQILKTLSSLESLEKSLKKVGNIVIDKNISDKMHSACDWAHQALDHLASGYLHEAFELSSRSFLTSEEAFFDSSLLELLYFPSDQKYAIYFPLFLPISLPLLGSVYYLTRRYVFKKP
ncbi:GPI transamidase component PIG-S [Halotydeus destructor]|nr:GPI transamidase component PIG-S [Halotydeus destructor]